MINIDSKLPNIALLKIEKYHKLKGDDVIWDFPLIASKCDKIYVSCIFTENRHIAEEYEMYHQADIGGTGYDIEKKLPEEIESIKLNINYGFTTRGCIRKCPFCFVPKKEGMIHEVGDIYDIWDGKSKDIVLLDNNILALPKHFEKICLQAQKENITIDFNQGLDIRLLNDDIASIIKSTKMKQIRFAYDSSETKQIVEQKMEILHRNKIKAMWYVLGGYNSTFEDALQRIEYLIRNNQRAYFMKHKNADEDKRYTALDRWCNSPLFGKGTIPFYEYLNNTEDGKRYLKYF